jgi:archaellum component FlaF (FlaF/FlaG flagellin family)
MKTTIDKILTLFIVILGISSPSAMSQNACDGYYANQKGTKYQTKSYDKKNKLVSISNYFVKDSDVKKTVVQVITTNDKGKETLNTDFDILCDGSSISIDQKKLMSKQITATMTDPSVTTTVSGNNLVTPNELTVGQSLPENEIDIEVKSSINMTVKFKTFDRKVIGKEKITVPAGTFDCMIVSANSDAKVLVSKKSTTKSWLAKGVGLVKQETYSKDGKLEKTDFLTAFSK